MKDRIIQFLSAEHISPAEFADKIGVQRSSMSHILNGRNYPSASFLQKMLQAYPLVNPRWLMIGEGQMNTELQVFGGNHNQPSAMSLNKQLSQEKIDHENAFPGDNSSLQDLSGVDELRSENSNLAQPITQIEAPKLIPSELLNPKVFQESKTTTEDRITDTISSPSANLLASIPLDKDVEKVIFFFSDKTFTLYRPS